MSGISLEQKYHLPYIIDIIIELASLTTIEKNLDLKSYFRQTDFQEGFIQKYNLPALKPSYFISAMDEYHKHFAKNNPTAKVYFCYFVSR